jgi:hypothetical protein
MSLLRAAQFTLRKWYRLDSLGWERWLVKGNARVVQVVLAIHAHGQGLNFGQAPEHVKTSITTTMIAMFESPQRLLSKATRSLA